MELSGCAHIDSNTAATGAVPIRDTLAAKVIINSTMKVLQIALLCLAAAANGFVVNPKSGSTRTAPSTKLNISGGVNPQEEMYDGKGLHVYNIRPFCDVYRKHQPHNSSIYT
mmetsp:Transcript_29796/g.43722  ORF Transcript_29796/g.43722 Transcript_29796/m.43722 type:complete len:112 (-) Transcript_29796:2795-3130(-)